MKTTRTMLLVLLVCAVTGYAQQKNPPAPRVQKTPAKPAATTQEPEAQKPPPSSPEHAPRPEQRPAPTAEQPAGGEEAAIKPMHFDMTEAAPVQTHHDIRVNGQLLKYTATTGRLPIKNAEGKIEAEMFFVAYTLDGADPATRPLTFAYNGGPGSSSIWLHMGALGPKKVVMQPEGWLPAAPYRFADNPYTPLDKTDLVFIDAIGSGYSRPADAASARRFWNPRGDVEAFGEFIRVYLSRYERWSSPLYLFGESYGTTRSAGLAGYLSDRGMSFNGIVLLSMVLNFQTLAFAPRTNDTPYPLYLPSYAMVAAYHHKLAPELMQDLNRTRAQVEQWAMGDYAHALAQGDKLAPQERQAVIDKLAQYTGLPKDIINQADLRIDVRTFTHYLLADQMLRVGRLDGRYTGPDPDGFMDTPFYDPTSSETEPPFTMAFMDYLRKDLDYRVEMPYYVMAQWSGLFHWGPSPNPRGGMSFSAFQDTATPLREALVKNQFLKVLVMEGYYDLATPFFAADYTIDHLDLPGAYRKNVSFATYDSGHMVYLDSKAHAKMKQDFVAILSATGPK